MWTTLHMSLGSCLFMQRVVELRFKPGSSACGPIALWPFSMITKPHSPVRSCLGRRHSREPHGRPPNTTAALETVANEEKPFVCFSKQFNQFCTPPTWKCFLIFLFFHGAYCKLLSNVGGDSIWGVKNQLSFTGWERKRGEF